MPISSKSLWRPFLFGWMFLWLGMGLCEYTLAAPWWSSETTEKVITIEDGIQYQRILYLSLKNEPVRAHILSVTGMEKMYQFGVLGSYGALFPPSAYAKQSGAIAVINGGFFSTKPNRARGLVMAHGQVLYSPYAGNHTRGAVGFNSHTIVIDWVGPEDIDGTKITPAKTEWSTCYAALGAGPVLIKNGHSRVNTDAEGFNFAQQAPRTAIGKTIDNRIRLIVVDGRQTDWSMGVTLQELAELMLSLKLYDAMNLDGGGSSTMIIKEEIVNRPSDNALPGKPGEERPVANVIALLKKE